MFDYFGLLFGGSAVWVTVALLTCFFIAALFRPERIRGRAQFRVATGLLALAVATPALVSLVVLGRADAAAVSAPAAASGLGYVTGLPSLLAALALFIGLDAVVLRGRAAE